MNTALVGYTGFVGSNLASCREFSALYNSKNIEQAYGTNPDLLVYAGVTAAKFLSNSAPEKDRQLCLDAFENICKINPSRVVLISTIDVYQTTENVDENNRADALGSNAYGKNRGELERLVSERFKTALIIRLPALFGGGLKKNFVYDMLTITPAMLRAEKYEQLGTESQLVKDSYENAQNGFYKLRNLPQQQVNELRAWFSQNSFNALSFTDSRAQFQFYNLNNLWHDIAWALAANISLINFTSQPVSAAEIYSHLTKGGVFNNQTSAQPAIYNIKTKYALLFGGKDGYMYEKEHILDDLSAFVRTAGDLQ